MDQAQRASEVAEAIWTHASVSPAARVDGVADSKPFQNGELLGIVLGSILFVLLIASLLGWLLLRLGLPPKAAAGVPLAILLGLVAAATLAMQDPTRLEWARLTTYLLTSAIAFVPLSKWLTSRQRRADSRPLSSDGAA
jgi:hypothetical protein